MTAEVAAGVGKDGGDRTAVDEAIDVAAVLVLAALGLLGLHNAYGGFGFLVVGMVAVLLGVTATWVLGRVHASPLVWILGLVAVALLASGIAVSDASAFGVLPNPDSLQTFLGGIGSSWHTALTTATPLGLDGTLGVVPYVCGFVAGAGGMVLAQRTRLSLLPAAPAAAVLVVSIVLGTKEPVSVVAQGALFAAVGLGWGSARAQRTRRLPGATGPPPRIVTSVGMIVVVSALALVLGPRLPLVDTDDRLVVRQEIEPPFDPRNEPSPLAGFRRYLQDDQNRGTERGKDVPELTVAGLPPNARVRLATMDAYDGVVWIVGGATAPASGHFERVGTPIEPDVNGQTVTVSVTSETDRDDAWLPTVGASEAVEFHGNRADQLGDSFRFNRTTRTGAVAARLRAGDSYDLTSVPLVAGDDLPDSARADLSVVLPALPPLPSTLVDKANEATKDAYGDAGMQAKALEQYLTTNGYFSNGDQGDSPSGHSLQRMTQMFDPKGEMVGNAEQYASAMALMARSLGLPARVVMGFTQRNDGQCGDAAAAPDGAVTFKGCDVDAWVEIAFEGYGWVPFDPTPDVTKVAPQTQKVPQPKPLISQEEPPPPTYLDPPEPPEQLASPPPADSDADFFGSGIPRFAVIAVIGLGVPALIIGAVIGAIVGLKTLRMRRRRYRGTPVDRLSGAWLEACDRAVDVGARLPRRVTRRETARSISTEVWQGASPFAAKVDEAMFGSSAPDERTVTDVWASVDEEREGMVATLDRPRRLKAAVNLRSFRRLR